MSGSEHKDPVQWFFKACLMILFGIVALSIAVDLLIQIWPWVVGVGIVVGTVVVGAQLWRERRQPW
ncbi:hypothetical protein NONI108955_22765 [Nocardia ninae]|uniref:Uncharacterized protein n=1 Tax=Nocardia ninae NBRC 108245 TaxID=1210091 RepID=A0A511MDK2_9NOCA|nr:hypothetical protein [Nocardia ninae]GEM38561.1 hypothetical protein NN4_30800 [Nocardia ninae NBRC 108245]